MSQKRLVFLTGLPRSGSTLLANLLAQHPAIHATPTSPLCPLFEKMRATWSNDSAALAQMEGDFDAAYRRLVRSTRAFIDSWSSDTPHPITVDKHRGWLFCIETIHVLYPDFKMIVCVRDLRDVYGSLERQHRRTVMLTFPDSTEQNLVEPRAAQFFCPTGVIGNPLRALRNLGDIVDLLPHLFIVRYEWFMERPEDTLTALQRWLNVEVEALKTRSIVQATHEADSYYRYKFPHSIAPHMLPPRADRSDLSPRILKSIIEQFGWFYQAFYRRDGAQLAGDVDAPGIEADELRQHA